MTYTYKERLGAGSFAKGFHLLGATRPLLPFQGGKWRHRHGLAEVFEELGFSGCPSRMVIEDSGPWARVLPVVLGPQREDLIDVLEYYEGFNPELVYDCVHGNSIPENPITFAAEYLFLQRLAFSGKAVGIRNGRWNSPGFNRSSAYGIPATDRFGEIKPMIPSLIRVLRSYASLAKGVEFLFADVPTVGPTLDYIDPPYRGTTRYPNGHITRADVVTFALVSRASGASVVVSEGEPIEELVAQGWTARRLTRGRGDSSLFRGKQEEWVTYAAGAVTL